MLHTITISKETCTSTLFKALVSLSWLIVCRAFTAAKNGLKSFIKAMNKGRDFVSADSPLVINGWTYLIYYCFAAAAVFVLLLQWCPGFNL